MRTKLVIATTAGVLALGGGLAVAVPALADEGSSTTREDRIRDALAGLVEDGALTGAQADEVAATLAESGLGRGHDRGGRLDQATAATALDLTEAELREALAVDGTSMADVAGEQGVDVDTLVDALVAAGQERIAQGVEDGELTQEEADERLAALEERITERVADEDPGPGGRGGRDRD